MSLIFNSLSILTDYHISLSLLLARRIQYTQKFVSEFNPQRTRTNPLYLRHPTRRRLPSTWTHRHTDNILSLSLRARVGETARAGERERDVHIHIRHTRRRWGEREESERAAPAISISPAILARGRNVPRRCVQRITFSVYYYTYIRGERESDAETVSSGSKIATWRTGSKVAQLFGESNRRRSSSACVLKCLCSYNYTQV